MPALLRVGAPHTEGAESYDAALAAAGPLPTPSGLAPEHICQISYTSGTTGRPKGVMLSNRAVHAGTIAMGHELGASPSATFLAVTPLFHIGSQVGTSCTYLGGTLVQSKRFEPAAFVETLRRTGATHCQLVPAMAQMVLDVWDDRAASTLQRILYGAAPMPPSLLRQALDTWGCEFVNGYGSTESTGISALAPHEHDPERLPHLLGSVGRSFALSVPRLVDDEDNDVPDGEIGEVLARSAATMSGYWRNPEETDVALRGGFMHTGDLAYRDDGGYLYLVDRRNDRIVTGGENVYPSEIEHVISAHPGVREAAVIGVPHRTWGEAVSAVVVLDEGADVTAEDILAGCRARAERLQGPQAGPVLRRRACPARPPASCCAASCGAPGSRRRLGTGPGRRPQASPAAGSSGAMNVPYRPRKNTSGAPSGAASIADTAATTMVWSPASCSSRITHSIHATAPSSAGPHERSVYPTPSKRSVPLSANLRVASSWWPAMMFTQNRPLSRMPGQVVDDLAGQNRISGGSSDTDVTEFAAMPVGPSAP